MALECLRDCQAWCCRKKARLRFDFLRSEAEMLIKAGGKIQRDPLRGGYILLEDCIMLTSDFKCKLHGLPEQPGCCKHNLAGEKFCLTVRKAVGL